MTASIRFLFLRSNGQEVTVSAPDAEAAKRKARVIYGPVWFLGISAQHWYGALTGSGMGGEYREQLQKAHKALALLNGQQP